jgi:hypothetical protein
MNKEQYCEIEELILSSKVDKLETKLDRYLSESEIDRLRASITHEEVIDRYSSMCDAIYQQLKQG